MCRRSNQLIKESKIHVLALSAVVFCFFAVCSSNINTPPSTVVQFSGVVFKYFSLFNENRWSIWLPCFCLFKGVTLMTSLMSITVLQDYVPHQSDLITLYKLILKTVACK